MEIVGLVETFRNSSGVGAIVIEREGESFSVSERIKVFFGGKERTFYVSHLERGDRKDVFPVLADLLKGRKIGRVHLEEGAFKPEERAFLRELIVASLENAEWLDEGVRKAVVAGLSDAIVPLLRERVEALKGHLLERGVKLPEAEGESLRLNEEALAVASKFVAKNGEIVDYVKEYILHRLSKRVMQGGELPSIRESVENDLRGARPLFQSLVSLHREEIEHLISRKAIREIFEDLYDVNFEELLEDETKLIAGIMKKVEHGRKNPRP